MRSFTMALVGLAVAIPVGLAITPAHADDQGSYNQTQHFDSARGDHGDGADRARGDRGDRYQRDDENVTRLGQNDQNDRSDPESIHHGDRWNRDNERQSSAPFGYKRGQDHQNTDR